MKHGAAAKAVGELRDFNADSRMLSMSGLALVLGLAGALLAFALLRLIYGATNLFYYHQLSWQFRSPAQNHLHWFAVAVPVVGGLLIGLMAKFGSDKIRGHGMPEAIEAILIHGARVSPRVAVFKPLSAAIAIGSGGPFGAEGPIIMTAGSVGSLFAQMFHLSDAERATLLVAGAAAGMAGVFATPLSAVLLAVELLLFEWRPRSLVPVAVAATTAGVMRRFLLGEGPLFPMAPISTVIRPSALLGALALGLLGGVVALVLSRAVYASEDFFEHRLKLHWMWWPAIGGVVIGVGGLIFPRALGTGYDVIASLIGGDSTWTLIFGVLLVKSVIWSFSLGSGTSGGILAPLLMIGGAVGALLSHGLPVLETGGWPLVGMAAVLSGAIGCPLTAAVLAMELTHNFGLMLPLLAGTVSAHAVTVLLQKRSILTERLSRRGYHLSREYGVDPLETMTVSQVMQTEPVILSVGAKASQAWNQVSAARAETEQKLYPVTGAEREFVGAVSYQQLAQIAQEGSQSGQEPVLPFYEARVCQPGETLRSAAERMAESGVMTMPVIEPASRQVVGLLSLVDLLQARERSFARETKLTRVRRVSLPFRGSREAVEEQEGQVESAV